MVEETRKLSTSKLENSFFFLKYFHNGFVIIQTLSKKKEVACLKVSLKNS